MLELLKNKKVIFFTAHQDDESLYFGGLLTNIKDKCSIKIISATEPHPGRPDTKTRKRSLEMVCWILNCEFSFLSIKDFPPIKENTKEIVYKQFDSCCNLISKELDYFSPDIVFTHNYLGEPNKGYPLGHITHRLISDCVSKESAKRKIKIFYDSVGLNHFDYEIEYSEYKKRALLNCYLPNWSPDQYDFVYEKEKFVEKR